MTALFITVGLVVYLTGCCLLGLMCSGDTRRQHQAIHEAAWEKRLRVFRDEAGMP